MKVRFPRVPFYHNTKGRFEEKEIHEVPDSWAAPGNLPKDTEIIEGPNVKKEPKKPQTSGRKVNED
tara:strand:- start:2537 stop:2734 length:198 start_codon:yes stop_codon:yes gene_type:complete